MGCEMNLDDAIVPIADLGEHFGSLRLATSEQQRAMAQSLGRNGQLTALVVFAGADGQREVVDGFKRLRAARSLGWTALRVRAFDGDAVAALAAVSTLNEGHGLSDLEEAWLCRSLAREHGLMQHQIGLLLGRHKSWVCRRLLLADGLGETVQASVRLGLLAVRSAVEIGRLSRDNHEDAAEIVMKRGLTTGQTLRLVQTVLALPDAATRTQWLRDAVDRPELVLRPMSSPRREKSPAEWLLSDIEIATRAATRLQVRLREHPLGTFDPRVAAPLRTSLAALDAVLAHLARSLTHTLSGKDLRDAVLE